MNWRSASSRAPAMSWGSRFRSPRRKRTSSDCACSTTGPRATYSRGNISRWGRFWPRALPRTISPWIVTMEALAPFRAPAFRRPEGDPEPLPYLSSTEDQERGGIDLTLEVYLASRDMREAGVRPERLSRSNLRNLYWTVAQLLTHHASNGCNLRPGDLLASGTVSGPLPEERGCLLELTRRGAEPIRLPTGEVRRFLEDGDEVILRRLLRARRLHAHRVWRVPRDHHLSNPSARRSARGSTNEHEPKLCAKSRRALAISTVVTLRPRQRNSPSRNWNAPASPLLSTSKTTPRSAACQANAAATNTFTNPCIVAHGVTNRMVQSRGSFERHAARGGRAQEIGQRFR